MVRGLVGAWAGVGGARSAQHRARTVTNARPSYARRPWRSRGWLRRTPNAWGTRPMTPSPCLGRHGSSPRSTAPIGERWPPHTKSTPATAWSHSCLSHGAVCGSHAYKKKSAHVRTHVRTHFEISSVQGLRRGKCVEDRGVERHPPPHQSKQPEAHLKPNPNSEMQMMHRVA